MSGLAEPIVTLSEAQAYVRIETGEEEALLAGLIRTASGLCEAFVKQVVIARDFSFDVAASSAWQKLPVNPVRSITAVRSLDANGVESPLANSDYSADIDFAGDGWVRSARAVDASRLRVSGSAGMADNQNGVPEPIRQGVLRLGQLSRPRLGSQMSLRP